MVLLLLPQLAWPHQRPFPVVDAEDRAQCRALLEKGELFRFRDSLPGDGKRAEASAFAEAAQRRLWLPEERAAMERWLRTLTARSELRGFFERIHSQGIRYVYRLGRSVERVSADRPLYMPMDNKDVVAEFLYALEPYNYQAGIIIYDLFFKTFVGASAEENDFRKMRAVFHELLHAFDGPDSAYSHHSEFLGLFGWRPRMNSKGEVRWSLDAMSPEAVDATMQQLNGIALSGRLEEARAESRRLGRELGLPQIYAALNPHECFAMLGDAVLFDPEAPSYIRPEVIAWFRAHVLR